MNKPKRFHIEPFFLVTKNAKGFLLLKGFCIEHFRGSKYVAPVLYRTFSSKSVRDFIFHNLMDTSFQLKGQ